MKNRKEVLRKKRHGAIRARMHGSAEKPRLLIYRSLNNMWAEVINDAEGKVLFSMSSLDKEVRAKFPKAGNVKASAFFGEVFAKRAKEKGISSIIFDRAGYLYHGRVKMFADALRKGGVTF
jgi:large subunit ribosomal protein L18